MKSIFEPMECEIVGFSVQTDVICSSVYDADGGFRGEIDFFDPSGNWDEDPYFD